MSQRKTLAVRGELQETLEMLEKRFPFSDQYHIGRVAVAYAIGIGLTPKNDESMPQGKAHATWAMSTFSTDEDDLLTIVRALFPDEPDAGEALNTLLNKGLQAIRQAVKNGAVEQVSDLLTPGVEVS